MDLTNSLINHKGNVVGIVRAELILAKMLHEIDSSIRYSIYTKYGFKEVDITTLKWLWNSKNINDDYITFQKSKKKIWHKIVEKIQKKIFKMSYKQQRHHRPAGMPRSEFFISPYQNGDLVYSCGWIDNSKQNIFLKLKKMLPDLKLVYTIYDLAMLQYSLKASYAPYIPEFEKYLYWISKNCNAIIYGGKTAKIDAEKYFEQNNLPSPSGIAVKWGCDIKTNKCDNQLKITEPYILAVGSFDYKKNYKLLYDTYCLAKMQNKKLPMLVIVGKRLSDNELFQMFEENNLIKDNVKLLSVNDKELQTLYENCLFTVLPTLYEGWSLTLPEALFYHKLCICSNVLPLKEVGKNFAHYLNPFHPQEWVDTIIDYVNHPYKIKQIEENIAKNWQPVLWKDSAQALYSGLKKITLNNDITKNTENIVNEHPKIFYDLNLINNQLTGIPRTELLLARNLYHIRKDIEFFILKNGNYYSININNIKHLLGNDKLDSALINDSAINLKNGKNILPFTPNSLVFSAGVGYDDKSYKLLLSAHKTIGFKFCQVIYDFTPITVPHTHLEKVVNNYPTFLHKVYELSDFIFYGGKTAKNDGEYFQKLNNMKIIPSMAVKWGSDITSDFYEKNEINSILKRCGITGSYIMTVGTIEARKNQQILYQAYLELLQDDEIKDKLPQLVICGTPGWKTNEFQRLLHSDERIFGKIITLSPTDKELDVLYKNCKFTCLASLYEGWSLTLPESLNYGKFCLASDTPSLTEIGKDIIDYANPYNPEEWAKKIKYYLIKQDALKQKENVILKKWHNTTWFDCANSINKQLNKILQETK